jgi:hypothetical protein
MTKFNKLLSKLLNCCSPNDSVVDYVWVDRPFVSVENQGLTNEKLLNCTVMSSHNSTLDRYQILGTSNLNILLEAINLNFRMLELDLFHDSKGNPVVSHGRKNGNLQVTSSVLFSECIDVISKYAMKNTNLPMIITLEINTDNEDALSSINEIIEKNLTGILVKESTELKDYLLKDLAGKYIILCKNSKINHFPANIHNHPDTRKYTLDLTELTRVYPDNVIMSSNYNFRTHLPANFISMNVGLQDYKFRNYISYFNHRGIIKNE